jgi:hypothetical protein
MFFVGSIINCGGGSSSGPSKIQAPKTLIQNFIAKHETMIDKSLVDFYVADEQSSVAAAIKRTIEEKTASGELNKLQLATFDFTNLQIAVVGEKEAYINDEPNKIIQIAVSGSYVMMQENDNKTIAASNNIVLQMVNSNWKVTEKISPWS